LHPPRAVLDIAQRLEAAGYETWCVGGAVRDALLGHLHSDWDLATAARPADVIRLFPHRTVPVGVAHGTVGVLDRERVMHEVTTFRRDVRTDGRHADVEFGVSLDDDLARRDFTINAIAYSPTRQLMRDPFGGRVDLARGIVRAVGRPADRMREDRLRALRALRFASRFSFTIEAATWEAIVASAPYLTRLSPERVREELTKTMDQVARPGQALALWRASGALATLVPVLANIDAVAMATLDCLPSPDRGSGGGRADGRADGRRLRRLAALFVGYRAEETRRALRALRCSNAEISWIVGIVAAWAAVVPQMEAALRSGPVVAESLTRRWIATARRSTIRDLLRIAAARWAAVRAMGASAPGGAQVRALYRRAVRSAYRDPVELADLAVDGDDLAGVGIAPGPLIGEILRRLLDAVIDDPTLNVRDRLIARARELVAGDES